MLELFTPYEFILLLFVIGISGATLTFARRYKNEDESAGVGVAAWTVFFIIVLLIEYL